MAKTIADRNKGNVTYQEVKLGYRGLRENPTIPLASAIDSIDELRELILELEPMDYVKAVYAKHPLTRDVKKLVFPGHRDLSYPHHSDIYFRMTDEWGIPHIDMNEKSTIPFDSPLYHEIVWLRGLSSTLPGENRPLMAFALGFMARFVPGEKLSFIMGSYISVSQVEEKFVIDRDLFHGGIEWMKNIARNCNADFDVSEIQRDLEGRLV